MVLRSLVKRALLLLVRHLILHLGPVQKVARDRPRGLAGVARGTVHVPLHGNRRVFGVDELVAKVEQRHLRVAHGDVLVVIQREDERPILGVQLRNLDHELHRDAAAADRVLLGDDVDGIDAAVLLSEDHDAELGVRGQSRLQRILLTVVGARVVKDDGSIDAEEEMVLDLTHEISRHGVFDQSSQHDPRLLMPGPLSRAVGRHLHA
mmetsp:Transcript_81088/g.196813  ORF Transcript_81088/g.196813 Transcript_81088/m.196813 type:complete len:207 (+) Transcript_81088:403-1023(+)